MYDNEESTCDIVGIFRRPPQGFAAPILIRGPANCAPRPPSLRDCAREALITGIALIEIVINFYCYCATISMSH